jgi:hypothetical protein
VQPEGLFFKNCSNSGVLSHFNSTASIVTGNWQRVDDFGFEAPASPTLFELYRKQRGAGPLDAWVILGRGEVERPIQHVDIAPTAAARLGVKADEMSGSAIRELLPD